MDIFKHSVVLALVTGITVGWLVAGCSQESAVAPAPATQPQIAVFPSPDAAVQAFIAAMRTNDRAQLMRILGPDADDLISSGDEVADAQTRQRFLEAYDNKHRLDANPDGSQTLNIGQQDWPLPIPVVKNQSGDGWYFDTASGKEEILNRRIGRNELTVIQVVKAIGDAQTEYAQRDPNGDGVPEYATKFLSDPGRRNGLYWEAAQGEQPSPLGAFVAQASAQGYSTTRPQEDDAGPRPYNGYYYRILTSQGPSAPGGAMDYMINGRLIGGFAVVAWPASYGNSGVMTFIVNHTGAVYQKDLGDDTDKLARTMTTYDPDSTWKPAE